MSDNGLQLARQAVDALDRGDTDAFIALCDSQFEMYLSGVAGEPVHYAGADGIRQFFGDMAESWSSFGFDIEELRDLADHVLVVGKQRGRGRASGIEVESRRALVAELRHGTLRSVRYFLEPDEAFAAVGL